MYFIKNFIFIVGFVITVVMTNSCTEAEKESLADDVINIDSLAVSPFQYSSYFKQIDYVPLEASKESLIGYVQNIHVYNDNFFVLDMVTAKRLFIFDLNGKFINVIGQSGKGKGRFTKIIDFSIERKSEEIYILDQIGKIIVFNFEGKFLREIYITGPTPDFYNSLEIVGQSVFLDIKYPTTYLADKNYLLREVTLEGKFKKDWLDMDLSIKEQVSLSIPISPKVYTLLLMEYSIPKSLWTLSINWKKIMSQFTRQLSLNSRLQLKMLLI
jgi:hypothetical protein